MAALANAFADSITIHFADGSSVTGTRDSMLL
jgi:hypothetical protein